MPREQHNRGKQLQIEYGVHATPLGAMFVAATQRGVCRAAFIDVESVEALLDELHRTWPGSVISESVSATRPVIDAWFGADTAARRDKVSLHVTGTDFQVAVWRALLTIPAGTLVSYSQVAQALGAPKAARAVANAVGANPVALFIPCHRVIRQSGALGGYRWGLDKKRMIQRWEAIPDKSVAL